MAQEKTLVPRYPVDLTRNTAPQNVARMIDDPVDDAQVQMGLAIRDAAIEQEAKAWLADRTLRAEERFATEGMGAVARLARTAKAVNAEFAGDDDIDDVVRSFNRNVVISTADSIAKQQKAFVEEHGTISQRDLRPRQRTLPAPQPVVVQAGPRLEPAPLFTTRQKYVIAKE